MMDLSNGLKVHGSMGYCIYSWYFSFTAMAEVEVNLSFTTSTTIQMFYNMKTFNWDCYILSVFREYAKTANDLKNFKNDYYGCNNCFSTDFYLITKHSSFWFRITEVLFIIKFYIF